MAATRDSSTIAPALRAPLWISVWFIISTIIVTWDASYLFLRPRSMIGGDLHWIWEPYGLYESVDLVYGPEYFRNKDGFPAAQAAMNVVENIANVAYLYLSHISPSAPSPAAPLVGFTAALMTTAKTVLYWLIDYYCGPNGWCTSGHNSLRNWLVLYALPNGFWIVVPFIITVTLGRRLIGELNLASAARLTKKSA